VTAGRWRAAAAPALLVAAAALSAARARADEPAPAAPAAAGEGPGAPPEAEAVGPVPAGGAPERAATPAGGAPERAATPAGGAPERATTPLHLRTGGGLGGEARPAPSGPSWALNGLLVALTAAAGAWAWKRRGGGAPAAAGFATLRVVGRLPLGARAEAVVVDVEGRRMMLGVTPRGVEHLADLDEGPAPALELAGGADGREPFANLLRAARSARAAEAGRDRDAGPGPARRSDPPEADERPRGGAGRGAEGRARGASDRRRSPAADEHDEAPPPAPRLLERQVAGLRRKGPES
jgi:flagellar biogenesis protein FliO